MPKKAGKRKVRKVAKGKPKKKVKKTVKRKTTRKPVRKTTKRKPAKKTAGQGKKTVKKKKTARKVSGPAKKATAKKLTAFKSTRPPVRAVSPGVPMVAEQRLGSVTHYYNHLGVAIIKLDAGVLQVGDTIHVKGHTTDCFQKVESMQIEHLSINKAVTGQEFGLKVPLHVREHDQVYKAIG